MERSLAETESATHVTDGKADEEYDPELEAFDTAWASPDVVTEGFARWDRAGKWAAWITIAVGAVWLILRSVL